MKVAVCIPSGDLCHVDFTMSLCSAMAHVVRNRRDIHCLIVNEKQTILEVGRHRLVCMAIGLKAEYILWVDTDMVFPYDTISRLVDSGKDIIGLQAIMRAPPHASNTYDFDRKEILYETGTKEVKYIGTGLLLTRTAVFEKIGMPYFKVTYQEDTEPHWFGEDLNFCDRARAAGYKIYCHCDLSKQLYHIGTKKYGYEDKKNDLQDKI